MYALQNGSRFFGICPMPPKLLEPSTIWRITAKAVQPKSAIGTLFPRRRYIGDLRIAESNRAI
jgi:hypothetical protein